MIYYILLLCSVLALSLVGEYKQVTQKRDEYLTAILHCLDGIDSDVQIDGHTERMHCVPLKEE